LNWIKNVNFDNWFNVKDDEVWGVSDELLPQKISRNHWIKITQEGKDAAEFLI
jgi:hypothetical protein